MTSKKRRRRRPPSPGTLRPSTGPQPAETAADEEEGPETRRRPPRESASADEARPRGLLGPLLRGAGGPSPFPGIPSSIGRGLLAIGASPPLLIAPLLLVLLTWLGLVALGLEGSAARLVDLFALPPVSTQYDLGTAQSIYGLSSGFPIFLLASLVARSFVMALLTGMVVEVLEGGSASVYGAIRGLRSAHVVFAVNLLSVGIIIGGNLVLPVLGPGIGFLGFVVFLVGGLYFLAFTPVAQIRERRGLQESLRRGARAAMLPRGRHMLICSFYFLVALPLMIGLAPGGSLTTANPSLVLWIYVLACNYVHMGFLGAFAYRWMAVEPDVPEEPVRRRRAPAATRGGRRAR